MIEQESKSAGKLKKRKVKAWCSECFQTFENGPYTKICREHITRGRCNAVECRKQLYNRGDSQCIRKFPNSNSENRHTYCISHEEVKDWKDYCNIQVCLGVKRSAETGYELGKVSNFAEKRAEEGGIIVDLDKDIKAGEKEKKESSEGLDAGLDKELQKEKQIKELALFDNLYPNLEYNLIDDIKNLTFFEGEKFSLDDNLIKEFNNFYFTPIKSTSSDIFLENKNKVEEPEKDDKNLKIREHNEKGDRDISYEGNLISITNNKPHRENLHPNKVSNITTNNLLSESSNDKSQLIKDDENIESIFEKVHTDTKIPKSILNKLKSAFKKKGILNAKILRLYKTKNKNFNFLIDDFGKLCTQIEGVALYLENIL